MRRIFKKISGARPAYHCIRRALRWVSGSLQACRVKCLVSECKPNQSAPNVIVSLTSFPARIKYAWIAIETIFQQTVLPEKVVLVLAEEEFPDRQLPRSIRRQEKRGLEILWVNENIRGYKKLLPPRAKYPDAKIITVDDDICYEPWRIKQLLEASRKNPGAIVGHRGWAVSDDSQGVLSYRQWAPATSDTPSKRIFLTNGAGTLFPPASLDDNLLQRVELINELAPKADDIWFWAVGKVSRVPTICLGNHDICPVRHLEKTPSLYADNVVKGENDRQLRKVIEYFGRSMLLDE